MTTPPPHKTEQVFRRYETHISTILTAWPHPSVFEPGNYSVETLCCGIRRAIASLIEFRWPTSIDISRLTTLEVVVSTTKTPGQVWCGPRNYRSGASPLERVSLTATPHNAQFIDAKVEQIVPKVNLVDPPADLVAAIIVMHGHRLLQEPSTIRFTNGETVVAEVNGKAYDVFVEETEKGTFTIL